MMVAVRVGMVALLGHWESYYSVFGGHLLDGVRSECVGMGFFSWEGG